MDEAVHQHALYAVRCTRTEYRVQMKPESSPLSVQQVKHSVALETQREIDSTSRAWRLHFSKSHPRACESGGSRTRPVAMAANFFVEPSYVPTAMECNYAVHLSTAY